MEKNTVKQLRYSICGRPSAGKVTYFGFAMFLNNKQKYGRLVETPKP